MPAAFSSDLRQRLEQSSNAIIDIRHDLHAHPELSFQEFRTTQVIRDRLVTLGWELRPCPTDTGAVAVLRGGRAGRRVMVRADIDGLPVSEEVVSSFTSRRDGVMHACGHDVHTASLLGVADLLAQRQEDLAGEFTLIFQPAEEGLGGARAMIEGGVLEANPVDVVIGAHVTSLAPVGFVASRAGIFMSTARAISIHLTGRGGHGAMASVDGNVVLAVSHLAPRLGDVVAGLSYEGTDCACSAGVIAAGTASNVVPRTAHLRGTLRTFTDDQQVLAISRLRDILHDTESRFHVTCTLELNEGTPAVTNNADVVDAVLRSAAGAPGVTSVLTVPPVSPSDDVSEFLDRVPGCYMFVGGAMADGSSGMHHSPDFAIDDQAAPVVASVLATCAVDLAQP